MRKSYITTLLWSLAVLAGCTNNPSISRCSFPPVAAPAQAPVAAVPAQAPAETANPAKATDIEADQIVVTRVAVSGQRTGHTVDTSHRLTGSPSLPIFASVKTNGSGSAKLTAIWKYETGKTIAVTTQHIQVSGPAETLFKIYDPHVWPLGRYQVEIDLDDKSAMFVRFMVTEEGMAQLGHGLTSWADPEVESHLHQAKR